MSLFTPGAPVWTSRLLSVLRIVIGAVYIMAGAMKAFGFPPPPAVMPPMPVIPPMWELHLAAWLEMIGGTALVLGFLTRPVAFLISGEMAVAYWQVHNPISPWLTASGGMPAAILCFTLLYMSFAGGGAWSIDSMIALKASRSRPS
jgi:putative oxidoreductase